MSQSKDSQNAATEEPVDTSSADSSADSSDSKAPGAIRERIKRVDETLAVRFWANDDIDQLLAERAALFDGVLVELWHKHLPAAALEQTALYAVGGYGRAELHPGSDIDLLVVVKRRATWASELEAFVQSLWDLGCEIGHSVRTVRECRRESADDISTATAMFERRLLHGSEKIVASLERAMSARRLWPSAKFFAAKRDEQIERHANFDNVEYGLEPNIKASPGGLRDQHTVFWVVRREYGTTETAKLVEQGVLTEQEENWLLEGKRFLSWVRYGLHLIAGRKEDRLQFEYQRELAQRFGYADTDAKRGVEGFMQLYYRHVLELREVNDIVLQTFEETIVKGKRRPRMQAINERFQMRNEYIETTSPCVFKETPSAMFEMFVIMATRGDIAGVRASTIRAIRENLPAIDDNFRKDPKVAELFLELLRAPYLLVSQLTRMRRYGLLSAYLPEFGKIVGQMQHDLFHIYTVDAHTMTLIGNLRRFRYPESQETYPVAHRCVLDVPKVELLYIAGLYHDIGKGRGGDHSQLGAVDAAGFCKRHGLSETDNDLVCWLVRSHLLMSSTAQRKDIHDPDVIADFASGVKTIPRLNYLYALTAADITATNPTLWNSWRASLLRQLYQHTREHLEDGAKRDRDAQLAQRRDAIAQEFRSRITPNAASSKTSDTFAPAEPGLPTAVQELMGEEFCFRYEPKVAADVLVACYEHKLENGPLIEVRDLPGQAAAESVTEILIYATDRIGLFRDSMHALVANKLAVYNAFIQSTSDERCLNAFIVLGEDGTAIDNNSAQRDRVKRSIEAALAGETKAQASSSRQRLPRQRQQMITPSKVTLYTPRNAKSSELTVFTIDRPGLLVLLGELFNELGIEVCSARINTLGNRVEDYFEIMQENGKPYTDPEQVYLITNTIRQRLDLF